MMTLNRTYITFIFLLAACFIISIASWHSFAKVPKSDVRVTPHKALYDIQLAGTKSGTQILNVSGQMLYEVKTTCDAWVSNHRFNLNYDYADSPSVRVTSDFSTFENYDGKSFNYTSQRKRNGDLFEELRGHAQLDENGGQALYKIPRGLEYDLSPSTLFPMQHTLDIISHAKQGKKFHAATIFDGSDEDGPVEVSAFIGSDFNAPKEIQMNDNIEKTLLENAAKKVRLAFFPLKDGSSESDYEMDLVFHDNGVISDMFIEYDDFSVTQKLIALEALEHDCQK